MTDLVGEHGLAPPDTVRRAAEANGARAGTPVGAYSRLRRGRRPPRPRPRDRRGPGRAVRRLLERLGHRPVPPGRHRPHPVTPPRPRSGPAGRLRLAPPPRPARPTLRVESHHDSAQACRSEGGDRPDGLGNPGRVADVAVVDGRVVAVGDDPAGRAAAHRLRRAGRHPGFVDTHAHSDLVHLLDQPQPFKLLQGVTSEVVGNCGLTLRPARPGVGRGRGHPGAAWPGGC